MPAVPFIYTWIWLDFSRVAFHSPSPYLAKARVWALQSHYAGQEFNTGKLMWGGSDDGSVVVGMDLTEEGSVGRKLPWM